MNSLRQTRRRRIVVTAIVFAWLPYLVLRCVPVPGSAHTACFMLGYSGKAEEHEVQHKHPGRHHEGRASTCCELTGKSNVTLPVPFAADPPLFTALAILPPDRGAPATEALAAPGNFARAHAPPAYLGNSALRL